MRKALSSVAAFALVLSAPVAAASPLPAPTQAQTAGQRISEFCKFYAEQTGGSVGECESSPANFCQSVADKGDLGSYGFIDVGDCVSTFRHDGFGN